ncbi:GLC7-interacting protein 2 [Phytophthora ramorum]|nr:Glucanase inhibitor protein 2 [Phytophthora ramorum]
MKVISAIAAVSLAVTSVAANVDTTERVLILGGSAIPSGKKTYTAGIRSTVDGDSYCGGSLVSPTHVLTTTMCVTHEVPNYVSVGTHYINGTQDGEQLKVVSVQNHTSHNQSSGAYDFALLTLEKPSKFTPVKLPKADDSDIIPGMWSQVMGWGATSFPNGTNSYELQGVGVEVWSNDDCAKVYVIDDTAVCAGGVAGKDSCVADTGGPLIKEVKEGDLDDILIGLVNWGYGCGDEGSPTVYSRVSYAVEWINSIASGASRTKGQ